MSDALLIVDLQRDFASPEGALSVPHGMDAVKEMLGWYTAAHIKGIPIFMSRDHHPADHSSFVDQGGPWPSHCVQGTPGVLFSIPPSAEVVIADKGVEANLDQYSVFESATPVRQLLCEAGVTRLYIGGLATEYCVRETVLDALVIDQWEVILILEGIRSIDEYAGNEAVEEMQGAGARLAPELAAFLVGGGFQA